MAYEDSAPLLKPARNTSPRTLGTCTVAGGWFTVTIPSPWLRSDPPLHPLSAQNEVFTEDWNLFASVVIIDLDNCMPTVRMIPAIPGKVKAAPK